MTDAPELASPVACAIKKLAVEINHGPVRDHDVLVQNRACASLRLRARVRTLPGNHHACD